MTNRNGFSLAELIVGLVVASLVSASIVQLMVVQSRFMNTQEGRANARAVSRGGTNLVLTDLRMVQATGGVLLATADSITVRVPFATGIMCANPGGGTDVMFPPVDSLSYAEGEENLAGYGWRNSTGAITWVESGIGTPGVVATSNCTSGSDPLTVPTGYFVRRLQPEITAGYRGAPVILHQRITYAFRNSTSVSGRRGLFRTRVAANESEELVAPFDTSSRFLFFWKDSVNAKTSPPANLDDLRGIELYLVGVNERAGVTTDAETSPLRTAVFFKN